MDVDVGLPRLSCQCLMYIDITSTPGATSLPTKLPPQRFVQGHHVPLRFVQGNRAGPGFGFLSRKDAQNLVEAHRAFAWCASRVAGAWAQIGGLRCPGHLRRVGPGAGQHGQRATAIAGPVPRAATGNGCPTATRGRGTHSVSRAHAGLAAAPDNRSDLATAVELIREAPGR